jgi:photosystem II stability/assembly factor-like uncharacterized protein
MNKAKQRQNLVGTGDRCRRLFFLICCAALLFQPAVVPKTTAADSQPPNPSSSSHLQTSGTSLLSEDFEDAQAQGWNYNPTEWQIMVDGTSGSHVWSTIPAGTAYASAGSPGWHDYRLALEVRRQNSDANVYFRRTAGSGYALRLESSRVVLWSESGGSSQDLDSASLGLGTTWHDYVIDAVGSQITVTVDSTVALTYTNSGPDFPAGSVALEAYANDGARFDNIQVTNLGQEPDPWVQTSGPQGGVIQTIELHPTDPDTVFAGGAGGVFKSTNGGALWAPLSQSLPVNERVEDLLIDPGTPQIMYAYAAWKLYKTTDGGLIWNPLFGGSPLNCVTMSFDNPQHLAIGRSEGSVWYSDDGGTSWSDITADMPGYSIKDIAFGDGDELWAGTDIVSGVGNGLLYHKPDGDTSWYPINNLGQAASSEIHTIFVDPQNHNIVYVGLADKDNHKFNATSDVYLVKTANGGTSWTPLYLPFTDAMVNVMGRASYDTMLYVGTGAQAFRSDDDTNWTWVSPSGFSGDMADIAVDPRNTDVLYLPRRAYGIVKSTDRGANWTPINDGLLNTTIALIALGDPSGGTLYAAAISGEGTYKSTDYGGSWTNVTGGGITHPWADELVVSPTDPQTIWQVADVGQFYVSHNGGISWTTTIDPFHGYGFRAGTISAAAIAPSDPDVVYAVKSGFGIFKSADGGWTWEFLPQSEVDYTYSLAIHPTDPDIVFSGYSSKPFQDWAMVRRSTDGGVIWTTVLSVPHSSGITSVVIDPQNPNTVYAGSTGPSDGGGGQIYHSTNGGDTWSPLNPHLTALTVWGQPQLIGDPATPSTAYAATWLGGTWKTTDAGQTWTLLEQAPQSSTALSLDPANPNVIYAADRTAPLVWKSADGGATWMAAADFSSTGAFLVNRVLAADGAVYASTFGLGLHEGKLYRSTNGGASWTDITNGLPRSVLDVSVDPSNAQTIYVTTHIYGAYKSIDGGATWSEMTAFPDIGGYDIEVDPVSPNIVYAAGLGATTVPDWVYPGGYTFADTAGVYKSVDSGQTWDRILATSNECRAIRIHPDDHDLLFASALSDGFFVSTNGGTSWTNVITGLDSYNLTSAWVVGDKVYAGTQGFGVYAGDVITATGTVTWAAARSNKPVPTVHNFQIQIDPTDSSRIYVGANPGGLFRSDDSGDTWSDKNFLTPSVVVDDPKRQGYYTFAINPADPDEVWVGTWGKGVYKSYDGQDFNIGANGSSHSMIGKHINALAFHPTLGVLAATEQGVFRTPDGGTTWTDWSAGLDTSQVRTLGVYTDGTVLCGTAGYELYLRAPSDSQWTQLTALGNFGRFWPIWNDRPLYQYSTLLFHPSDPNTIYFGTFPSGIFKSLDGGMTWREYNVGWLNDGVFTLTFHPQNTDIVYAGTYNGLNRSLDGGAHWERWDAGWPGEQWVFSIAFDPRDPDVMYACSKNGENEGTGRPDFHGTVMKSTDSGEHWSPITTGLDVGQEFYKIIVDKFEPDTLYLATQHQGVYISYDGGNYWGPWNDGLTNLSAGTNGNNVTNMMALSDSGLYLYFGSAGSGVFRRMTLRLDHRVYLPMATR